MENSINIAIWKESVFSDFFKTHIKSLNNFLVHKYGSENHAEDVAQEAFIKLWQNSYKIPLEKAKTYIYTIANNASLNVIAHEKVKLSYEKNNSLNDKSNENPEFLLEEKQFII
jgi:DNA-directed RNA polymerase specialized sigma24 family protein